MSFSKNTSNQSVPASSQKIFVAVAGNIGTGKTTLTEMLAKHFQWQAHFESVSDNPYLADFYTDMKRWSFPLQIYFMTHRVKSHQQISLESASAIQDRTIYEDANIFARNLFEQGQLEERDYKNYIAVYDVITGALQPPDLMIYLRKSLPRLKEQIKKRGRDYEQDMPEDYLGNLNRYYDEWIGNYTIGKKLVIESDDLDFVARPEDFSAICARVVNSLDQQDLFMNR
jgi:deoxyadenosine/deoxycytidine kinase